MKRTILAFFSVWSLIIQSTWASAPQAINYIKSEYFKKYLSKAISDYNNIAKTPNEASLTKSFSGENLSTLKSYMKENKIKEPLPGAIITPKGTIELKMKGQSDIVEIDPVTRTLKINGSVIVLKSVNSLKERLNQLEKILKGPAKTSMMEKVLSIVVSEANADCLSKYDSLIDSKMPKREGIYKLRPPAMWVLSLGIITSLLLGSISGGAGLGMFPAVAGFYSSIFINDKDGELIAKERQVQNDNYPLFVIDDALKIAKTGEVPKSPESGIIFSTFDEVKYHFIQLYRDYSDYVTKKGGTPYSDEEFLKALVEGDQSEKFCKDAPIEKTSDLFDLITPTNKTLDPNTVNKPEDTAKPVIDDSHRDLPKAKEESEQSASTSASGETK